MADELFEERRRSLEEVFFRKHNQEVLDRLRSEERKRTAKETIAAAVGVRDEAVLGRLVDLGFDASTLIAFGVVPAVEVAWADGSVDEAERKQILERIAQGPLPKGSAAYEMVSSWLSRRPSAELFEAWIAYTRTLCATLKPGDREWLASAILGKSEAVAQASGGVLGLALKTSGAESAVLRRIEAAFAE